MFADLSIAIMARQAGTANAFEPLIDELLRYGARCSLFALGQARSLWQHRPQCESGESFAGLRPKLQADASEFLLTGTSEQVADDWQFWAWADQSGLPSVAFVDSWANVSDRFTRQTALDSTPTKIAVIDESVKAVLTEAGLAPGRVEVLGHPAFDSLRGLRRDASTALVIVGEPGAKAHDVIDEVVREHQRTSDSPIVIRPHPREDRSAYDRFLGVRHVEIDTGPRLLALSRARTVVGVGSMLLVEAALAGIPVLSVQSSPELRCQEMTSHPRIRVLRDTSLLAEQLGQAWSQELAPVEIEPSMPRWIAFLANRHRWRHTAPA